MFNFGKIARKHWGAIVIMSLFGAVSALWLSMQQTPMFASNTRILIAYKKFEGVDGYSALRATEKMGQNLANIVGTASFLDKVLQAGFSVNNTFPQNEQHRRDMWIGMLDIDVIPDTSILDISVLHPEREQAERIVAAISSVLINNAHDYLGIDNLNIQVVDAPLTSHAPVEPQIPVNTAMGFLVGLLLSSGVTLLRELFIKSSRTDETPSAALKPVYANPLPYEDMMTDIPLPPAQEDIVLENNIPETQMPKQEPDGGMDTLPAPTVSTLDETLIASLHEHIKTMHDHVKQPFGGKYFFQHKLIHFDEAPAV